MEYVFLFLAIVLLSAGQVAQKFLAMKNTPLYLKGNKPLYATILFMSFGTLFWLLALITIPLSHAYPYMSVSVILVMLYAVFFLRETVNARQWFGALIIMVGLCLTSS